MRTVLRKGVSAAAILGTGRHWRCRAFVLVAEIDPSLGQVIRRHFDRDAIPGKDADAIFLHLAGGVGEGFVPVVEPHPEPRIGEKAPERCRRIQSDLPWPMSTPHRKRGAAAPLGDRPLGRPQVDRRNSAALALLELVAQLLAFIETVHAGLLDRRDMDETSPSGLRSSAG